MKLVDRTEIVTDGPMAGPKSDQLTDNQTDNLLQGNVDASKSSMVMMK